MRFLVVTKSRGAPPPEMAMPMMQMMQQWVTEHLGSGKMEQVWSFGGIVGGGGILDVDSHEELDSIMGAFPFAQFSDVEVYPLADLHASLSEQLSRMEEMMAVMSGDG